MPSTRTSQLSQYRMWNIHALKEIERARKLLLRYREGGPVTSIQLFGDTLNPVEMSDQQIRTLIEHCERIVKNFRAEFPRRDPPEKLYTYEEAYDLFERKGYDYD